MCSKIILCSIQPFTCWLFLLVLLLLLLSLLLFFVKPAGGCNFDFDLQCLAGMPDCCCQQSRHLFQRILFDYGRNAWGWCQCHNNSCAKRKYGPWRPICRLLKRACQRAHVLPKKYSLEVVFFESFTRFKTLFAETTGGNNALCWLVVQLHAFFISMKEI